MTSIDRLDTTPSAFTCPTPGDFWDGQAIRINGHVPRSTTFRFRALTSRLRGCFVPDEDTYPDRRITTDDNRHKFPHEMTRLTGRIMKPNFQWDSVIYVVDVFDSTLAVVVFLTPSGVPTGVGVVNSASLLHLPSTGSGTFRPTYHTHAVQREAVGVFIDPVPLRITDSGLLRSDLRFPGYDGVSVTTVPFSDSSPLAPEDARRVRYLNLETRRRATRQRWGGRAEVSDRFHGPVGQPREGFTPAQFWARYCGGGYHVTHEEHDFITIGTGVVIRQGITLKLRRGRGRHSRRREATV